MLAAASPDSLTVLQWIGIFIAIVVVYLLSCIRILFEYQRGVVFRLGRVLPKPKGPGLIFVFWPRNGCKKRIGQNDANGMPARQNSR